MNVDVIKKIRDTAEAKNLNLEILFDNMEIMNTKAQGSVVNFDDANELVVCTRITDSPTRMLVGPLEFVVKTYDEIQKLTIQAGAKDMFSLIDEFSEYCGNKADDMRKFVETTPATSTYHHTTSVENVTDRAGTKPTVYSTNEYNSRGEARKKSSIPKRITVTVNEDGTVSGADKIPHPSANVTSTSAHVENGTIM